MIKYLFIIFLLLTFNAYADTTKVSCDFGNAADVVLTSYTCDIGDTNGWTVEFDDCVGGEIIEARDEGDDALDNARADNADDCQMRYSAQPNPTVAEYFVESEFDDIGTNAATAAIAMFGRCIDCTSSTTQDYYTVFVYDDVGNAYQLFKIINASPTSLGTGGAFSDAETVVIKLELKDAQKKVFEAGSEIISSDDNAITGAGVAGLSCGEVTGTANDDCSRNFRYDDFKLVEIAVAAVRRLMIISMAEAQERVRDGIWYVSPVVKKNGIRMPKAQTIPDPGKPMLEDFELLLDGEGNVIGETSLGFIIPQFCHMSNVIGDSDIPDEWALSYIKCADYSNLDADTEIIKFYPELDGMGKRLNQLSNQKKNSFKKIVKDRKSTTLTDTNTVRQWIESLGKDINPQFSVKGTWVK